MKVAFAAAAAVRGRSPQCRLRVPTMAAPKAPPKDEDTGMMRRAMAMRVKDRKLNEDGVVEKRILLQRLGVHPKNRGGVYPQRDVVKRLLLALAKESYQREEADHNGVCVEEVPRGQADGKETKEAYLAYNRSRCGGSGFLEPCFGEHEDIMYGTLSHSHLLLVLRCWLGRAKFDPTKEEEDAVPCDSGGRLHLAAVAADGNLAEMKWQCSHGLQMEVLSWKIFQEAPEACSLISQALNNGNAVALKTRNHRSGGVDRR